MFTYLLIHLHPCTYPMPAYIPTPTYPYNHPHVPRYSRPDVLRHTYPRAHTCFNKLNPYPHTHQNARTHVHTHPHTCTQIYFETCPLSSPNLDTHPHYPTFPPARRKQTKRASRTTTSPRRYAASSSAHVTTKQSERGSRAPSKLSFCGERSTRTTMWCPSFTSSLRIWD